VWLIIIIRRQSDAAGIDHHEPRAQAHHASNVCMTANDHWLLDSEQIGGNRLIVTHDWKPVAHIFEEVGSIARGRPVTREDVIRDRRLRQSAEPFDWPAAEVIEDEAKGEIARVRSRFVDFAILISLNR